MSRKLPVREPFAVALSRYETWVSQAIGRVDADLERKHALMRKTRFAFLRASYFRWVQRWPTVCAEVAHVPQVLAVGDVHVANFGSWLDGDGRLVWGINDFDDAHRGAYTSDLVRLMVSARFARDPLGSRLTTAAIVDAIVDGYRTSLGQAPKPFVLSNAHSWLRAAVLRRSRDPETFWRELLRAEPLRATELTAAVRRAVASLPAPHVGARAVHRVAGLGSLGRFRVIAIARWHGDWVARETRPLVASASAWAAGASASAPLEYVNALRRATRSPDPTVHVEKRWLIRRLAADSSKLELADLAKAADVARLLGAMGAELANIHRGSARPAVILQHLQALGRRPLIAATKAMATDLNDDYRQFRNDR